MQQSGGFFDFFNFFTYKNMWILEIIAGIIVLFIIDLALGHIIKFLQKKNRAKENGWKMDLRYIFHMPIKFLLVFIGVFYVIDILANRFNFIEFMDYINPFRNAVIVICVTWFVLRWKKEIQKMLIDRSQKKKRYLDHASIDFIGKLFTIAVCVMSLLIVLEVVGVNVMPLVAFGGIGAAAIGFAAKDVISNFFGGMMMYITRPVIKGEFIDIPDKKISGLVENIGWYITTVRDYNKCPLYLPNSIFSTSLIKNLSRMTHRRIDEKLQIRYKDFANIQDIIDAIKKYVEEHDFIDTSLPVYVYLDTYAEYSINIDLRCYVLETNYEKFLAIKQDILLNVKKIIVSFNAEMPFPTTHISGLSKLAENIKPKL
jgi:MscS family membrane protein